MPYKDHETYLRKQREFYYRRKARAQRIALIRSKDRVNHASIALTPPSLGVERTHVLAASHDPNHGIALRFQPAAKEKFQVDDFGNARRIVRSDES
jgi:hypothetical protein